MLGTSIHGTSRRARSRPANCVDDCTVHLLWSICWLHYVPAAAITRRPRGLPEHARTMCTLTYTIAQARKCSRARALGHIFANVHSHEYHQVTLKKQLKTTIACIEKGQLSLKSALFTELKAFHQDAASSTKYSAVSLTGMNPTRVSWRVEFKHNDQKQVRISGNPYHRPLKDVLRCFSRYTRKYAEWNNHPCTQHANNFTRPRSTSTNLT